MSADTPGTDLLFEIIESHIALVTLNRPSALNAINPAITQTLEAIVKRVEQDKAIRVAILASSSARAFCAGADLKEIAAGRGPLTVTPDGGFAGFVDATREKPWIAAVNGFALGGGCETAMACTIRVAAEHARFGQPEVKLGLLPGGGGTQRLPRLVGKGRALQLILTGGTIDAREAWRIGLVNEVVPAADLIARAEAILAEIFANAPIAVSYALDAVNRGLGGGQAEGLALEAALFGVCAGTADKAEGAAAFLEKRAPVFQGR